MIKRLIKSVDFHSCKAIVGVLFVLLMTPGLNAQKSSVKIEVLPYLQNAKPTAITIRWQTDQGEESIVEWGTSQKLGKKTKGRSEPINYSDKRLHTVTLNELNRMTVYYYRVKTENTRSDIFQFKTPPFEGERPSFNLVAMSDMQIDHNYPEKFREVVDEGVIDYFESNYEGTLPENLAMVLATGDLVENGTVFHQWENYFFDPAQKLFSQVPVYPVLGNHEINTGFYFRYFDLPKNGTPAFDGHWWYKDYGNTRIVGLNSNKGYRNKTQLGWLKRVLKDAADTDNIDFVFAQMHHPHKSELWIPGEADYSGEIVKLLEEFTESSGKPSIHFFGHTHGYSRGQSKDHKHLWVNVASAGGAIDNWGEFEGRDYDEFSVTQDEYGFVLVEVDGDKTDPKFTLKRVSRGNNKKFRDNELRDSITIWRHDKKPSSPVAMSPKGETVTDLFVQLKAGEFRSERADAFHAASHWQMATNPEFKNPVFDRWKQHENWYYEENRQKDDDLTDEMTNRLKPGRTYYWRVRYRDQHLNWSDWSEVQQFTVDKSQTTH